ncbi:MAG: 4'-phosphopantetheinyl transferase superfamily protein, partial [Clostridia bacterium]|nr:4'-phosphopantetheinyl transferase superfamily protein [Clostridia bacterium]
LFISISHSGDYAFLALSDSEIGIDVQQIKQVQSGLIEKTLTKLERESLQEKEQFFTFWSVKESYLKLIGTGLSAGLKNVEFNLQNGNISFNQKPQKVKTYVEEQNNYIFSIVAENLTDKILIENVKI